jgi:hypothetical protein
MTEFCQASAFGLTCDDPYTCFVTSVDHFLVLGFVTALGYELVGDGLIVGPPLGALDVLLRGAHLGTVSILDV